MLRECAQRLVETGDFIRNVGNRSAAVTTATATTVTSTTSTAVMPQPQANPSSASTDGRIHDTVRNEHNRLFGYRPPAPTRARQSRGSGASRRRINPYTNSAVGRANATWSRSFVCLAVAGQQMPPSTSERIELSLNGLGEKKLTFPKVGNAAEVHDTILAAFPALGGGYEILRAGDGRSRELMLITMPTSGFSVSFLQSVLGQAKGYLRPLQRDIVMETCQGTASSDKVWK